MTDSARLCLLACLVPLAACRSAPPVYAPPAQQSAFPDVPPARPPELVWLADPDAAACVFRDIRLEGGQGNWFWAGPRPAVRIHTGFDGPYTYSLEFVLTDEQLAQTGPVTVSYLVDGRLLGRVPYGASGHQVFTKPVPRAWIQADRDVIVSAEVDKPYRRDGALYSFQMSSLGFIRE